MSHIENQIFKPELTNDTILHAVRVVSNPVRYHSRYRLMREQEESLADTPYLKLYTVEAAFGDRQPEIVSEDNPSHLLVRTNSEIWIKENLINLGVKHLVPRTAKYIAWIDGDVTWPDKGWALETIHQLQHFHVVQPWVDALDLGHLGTVFQHFKSFGYQHQMGIPKQMHPSQPYKYAHTGFAWACTRAFWEATQGLMDFPILGSADHHMAFAMINEVDNTIHGGMQPSFFNKCHEWQTAAMRITKGQVGYVPCRLEHHFHGPKNRRQYRERWQILVDHNYDPAKDIMYNEHGVITLIGKPELEHAIQLYNRNRYEDSIEEF